MKEVVADLAGRAEVGSSAGADEAFRGAFDALEVGGGEVVGRAGCPALAIELELASRAVDGALLAGDVDGEKRRGANASAELGDRVSVGESSSAGS